MCVRVSVRVCVRAPTLQLTALQISILSPDVVSSRPWTCSCVSGPGAGTVCSSASSWTRGEQASELRRFHEGVLFQLKAS